MVTLYYRGQSYLIMVDGIKASGDSFCLNDYQKHSLLALPISDNTKYLPICGYVQANTVGDILLSANFDCIHLRRGEYEILPIFIEYSSPAPPMVLLQERYQDILATVYRDFSNQFIVEDADTFYSHPLPSPIDIIRFYESNCGTIIYASGNDYLLMVIRRDGDFHLLFERQGCQAEFDGYVLNITIDFEDTMLRQLKENYSLEGGGFVLSSQNFNHKLQHKYIPELLPTLLIDAIMVGDYDYAQKILAPDLAQNVRALSTFFGEIICYYNNPAIPIPDKCLRLIVVEDNRKIVKIFNFTHNNHHITDISVID